MVFGHYLAALRRRLGRHAEEGEEASREELETLVTIQTEWWERRGPISPAREDAALRDLNERSWSVFVFLVQGRNVSLLPKPWIALRAQDQTLYEDSRRLFDRRAMQHQEYLQDVLDRSGNTKSFRFAFDAADEPRDSVRTPIFSLNKKASAHNILLPDTDFFNFDWYRDESDPFSYEAKTPSACFAGSSTGGGLITLDRVQDGTVPRLRTAKYFLGHPDVEFRITRAVSCESPAVERHIRDQPWFGPPVTWRQQLRHRFVISMDGHGAAWSRVIRALRSNSVLLKYDSPMIAYYYPALTAGRHWLSIGTDADVLRFIEMEKAEPGRFRSIAEESSLFARKFLNPASVREYTALLLARFAGMR